MEIFSSQNLWMDITNVILKKAVSLVFQGMVSLSSSGCQELIGGPNCPLNTVLDTT